MKNPFGKDLYQLDEEFLREAYELDSTGSITIEDGEGGYRVTLTPEERDEYVAALSAFDEFLGHLRVHERADVALAKVSDARMRTRVHEYNDWTVQADQIDTMYCFAAFLGEHLEELLCGNAEDRYEPLD